MKNILHNRAFTTKREKQKRNSYFSFANERWEKTQSSGFTLIETLVAVSILTLSIAGPLYTANSAIVAAENARNQLTASYLAQEGIEYVHWMRDNEYLSAYQANPATASIASWSNFLTNGLGDSAAVASCRTSTCTLDPAASGGMGTGSGFSLQQCSGSSCTPLYLSNNIYTQQVLGTKTPFTRTIQVLDIPGTEGTPLFPDKRIISTISWSYHTTSYSVTITDHLTPWQ